MSLLRRARAAAVLAGFWSVVWALAGVGFGLYRLQHGGPDLDWALSRAEQALYLRRFALWWGGGGGFTGFVFALLLASQGRERRSALSARTIVGWGALAGTVVPLVVTAATAPDIWRRSDVGALLPMALLWASLMALGAACAWLTWVLAARRPSAEPRVAVPPAAT